MRRASRTPRRLRSNLLLGLSVPSGIRPDMVDTVQEILTLLDDALTPQEFDLPGYRLHPLKGDLKGFWAVTVRANWRIIFRFEGTDAFDVELIDYH